MKRPFGGLASQPGERRRLRLSNDEWRHYFDREHGAGHEPGTRPDACGKCREAVRKGEVKS